MRSNEQVVYQCGLPDGEELQSKSGYTEDCASSTSCSNHYSRRSTININHHDSVVGSSTSNFYYFSNTKSVERCSANPSNEKGEGGDPTGPKLRQSSIRDYCNVVSRPTVSYKRKPFGDITNTYSQSPKSRLEALKPHTKRLNRRGGVAKRQLVHSLENADLSSAKSQITVHLQESRRRSISLDESGSSSIIDVSFSSTTISTKSSSSTSSSSASRSTTSSHKRYCTAIAENAYTHLDDSTIPETARARTSLHRVHSTSFLEVSFNSSADEHSPEKPYSLATVQNPTRTHTAFAYLSAETLHELLASMCESDFQRKFVLIDCRFPYEYEGGHIMNAMNLFDTQSVEEFFYPKDRKCFLEINARIPIFYCEYSQKRGPSMAMALRKLDRVRNENRYPKIDYKEIYVLYQGYRNFFNHGYQELCTPSQYVPMTATDHKSELAEYSAFIRQNACYTLYGTETRFHQQTTKRYNELLRSQMNDSFMFTEGESLLSESMESSSLAVEATAEAEHSSLAGIPDECTSSGSDGGQSGAAAGSGHRASCSVRRRNRRSFLQYVLHRHSNGDSPPLSPKAKHQNRRRQLQALRHMQISAFKRRFKRSNSDSSALTMKTADASSHVNPLLDAFAMDFDDDRPAAGNADGDDEIENDDDVEMERFSRMSVQSPKARRSTGNLPSPIAEECLSSAHSDDSSY